MPRSKTRLAVTVNGIDREIISIREGADGSLSFIPAQAEAHDHPDGSIRPTKERRISLHQSPDSPGHLIKYHEVGKDDSIVHTTAFVHPANGGFSWRVIAKKSQTLDLPRYVLKSRGNDKIVNLGEHDPAQSTLLYAIYATDAKRPLEPLWDMVHPYRVIEFKSFRIFVSIRYLNFPSLSKGTFFNFITSPPRIDNAPVDKKDWIYVESMGMDEMALEAHLAFTELRRLALRHVGMLVGDEEERIAAFESSRMFSIAPEFSEDYEGESVIWYDPVLPLQEYSTYSTKFAHHLRKNG